MRVPGVHYLDCAGPSRHRSFQEQRNLRLEADAGAVKQHLVVQIARPDGAKRSGTRYTVEHAIQQADGIVAFSPL
jgi:hypothetical protein